MSHVIRHMNWKWNIIVKAGKAMDIEVTWPCSSNLVHAQPEVQRIQDYFFSDRTADTAPVPPRDTPPNLTTIQIFFPKTKGLPNYQK